MMKAVKKRNHKKVISQNAAGLTPEELKRHEKAMIDIFEKGILPAEALGFSEEFLNHVYRYAYNLYQQNKIEEASQLFRWLKAMVPAYPKFTIALIQCFIQQKNWLAAVANLMELAYQDLEDPMPFVKMSECLMEAEDYGGALITMEKAIERAGNKQQYAQEKERWIMNYDYILSKLNIDPAIVQKVREERKNLKI
ncbi:MAG: hypothetical protein HWD61_09225 [Parachlamydiaceae bacterium]|nr:MAG: hypothetical protein HWD61_09225 [Parachlamydiaceae bacterium]